MARQTRRRKPINWPKVLEWFNRILVAVTALIVALASLIKALEALAAHLGK